MRFSSLHPLPILLGLVCLGWFFAGCNTTKRLKKDEVLYTGAEVAFQQPEVVEKAERVEADLKDITSPSPNASLWGLRPQLWVYQRFGQNKEKGLGPLIQRKLGEPPVLLDTALARRVSLRMEKYLQDQGYFGSKVRYKVQPDPADPTAVIRYEVTTPKRYRIGELRYPQGEDPARQLIRKYKDGSPIQPGTPYRLAALQAERSRITRQLRNSGYANFYESFLYFTLDTLSMPGQVRVAVQVKDPSDATTHRRYQVQRIFVYPDYTLDQDTTEAPQVEGPTTAGLSLMGKHSRVRLKTIQRHLLVEPGGWYSAEKERYTLKHLQDLGTYKFVNLKYQPAPGDTTLLNYQLYLTPRQMQEVGVELEADVRTGLFSGYGTNLSLSYTHYNLFGGGERFQASVRGSAVFQPGDTSSIINTLDLSARADLYVPRLLLPFKFNLYSKAYIPQTKFSANYSYQERINFYALGSLGFSFGYAWKANAFQQHEFTALSLQSINLLRSAPAFDSLLRRNPFLQSSFSDVLILGPRYSFTYQEPPGGRGSVYHYFRGVSEFSGNLLNLGYRTLLGPPENGPYKIFGRPFAQYSRFELDYRFYWKVAKQQTLAARFAGGVGVPYGNSEVLPYLKQFFTGGPVGLRAFRLRTLGPGSFQPEARQDELGFVDQTGDILLESTLEYRFPIYSYVKGALFTDVGNIWLLPGASPPPSSEVEARRQAEGVFSWDTFGRQLAVGAGVGLRLDVDFFVLRLDLAFPLHKPFLPRGERWVVDKMQPFYWPWLSDSDNAVLNLAIGYPF